MKKTLVIILGMAAVFLCGMTQEERKKIVRDSIPQLITHAKRGMWGDGQYYILGYDALPEFYEILKESIEDREIAGAVMDAFAMINGFDLTSKGEREALNWARKVLLVHSNEVSRARLYLELKGDAEDLRFLKELNLSHPLLEMRVGGTNIAGRANYFGSRSLGLIPSVANVGPQAVYVCEILKRCGQDIPEELLTMVVSFDKEGNPVSSVNLEKYNLSMPVITPKPEPRLGWGYRGTATFPHEIKAPIPMPDLPISDEILRRQVLGQTNVIFPDRPLTGNWVADWNNFVELGDIAPERITKTIEGLIREILHDMKKAGKDSEVFPIGRTKLRRLFNFLQVFKLYGPNTFAVLKECASAKIDDRVTIDALCAIIHAVGAVEALPIIGDIFIEEVQARNGKGFNFNNYEVYAALRRAAKELIEEGKEDDARKVYTVLIGLTRIEYQPTPALSLDNILCSDLPDYATSANREYVLSFFEDKEWGADRVRNALAEIRKVPANKRRDYGKQPLQRSELKKSPKQQ